MCAERPIRWGCELVSEERLTWKTTLVRPPNSVDRSAAVIVAMCPLGRTASQVGPSTQRPSPPSGANTNHMGRQRDLTRAQEDRSAMTAGPMVIGYDGVSLDECADGLDLRSPPDRRRRVA